jgi:TRAP-type C4-dicarboxylate transport system permease small subunit
MQARPIYFLARMIDWALVVAATIMVVLVFFNVCAHVVGRDVAETIETCELMMVWVSFLGGASIVRRSGHLTITEFLDKLDKKGRLIADFFVQLIALVVLSILFWTGLILVQDNWTNLLIVLQIPISWQYMALPAGSFASMVFVVYDLCLILQGKSREERYGEDD